MATPSDPAVVNATLVGTAVDTVQITGRFKFLEVLSRGANTLWVRADADGVDPVAEGEGSFPVPAGSSYKLQYPKFGKVRVLGNGDNYSVVGTDFL